MENEQVTEESTPRINGNLMPHYITKVVRVVGQVEKIFNQGNEPRYTLTTSDGVSVTVIQDEGSATPQTPYVEVVGTVINNVTIQEILLVDFGKDFDMKAYDQCVKLINGPFQSLFV
ncbi:putative replication factor A3 [Blattamonas nauphoetae]|uniref:Replication factor A3 n=1 Tax=Blattamonas nauphoetae TaxID=2049346 RepID=A0ABQ9YF60_9EUKA|nr:putative replication factor A3 [Blattamonas nauphoetae]